MARKKEPSAEDAIKYFKEIMHRAELYDYSYVSGCFISKNKNGSRIFIVPDEQLAAAIYDDVDLKDHIQELDTSTSDNVDLVSLINQIRNLDSEAWIAADNEVLFKGKLLKVYLDKYEYDISIHKALIPLKLKKSEYTDIYYRIISDPYSLVLNKRFPPMIEGYGFNLLRVYQIV